jgi:hypothetical protein
MRSNDSVYLDKPLGLPSRFEPSHSSLPFAGRLMRVLCPVIQVSMLPVRHARHHYSFRCSVTAQFVRNNDPRFARSYTQKLAKESHRGKAIPLRLNQNIEDNAVLINSAPEVVSDAIDLEEDFIEMPFITGSGTSSPESVRILFAELFTPTADRLVREQDTTCRHHVFHVAEAHPETEVEPNAFGNDFPREAVTTVRIIRHSFSVASPTTCST